MPAYRSPFQLTHRMTALVADIAERLGAWKAANRDSLVLALRRGSRTRLRCPPAVATRSALI